MALAIVEALDHGTKSCGSDRDSRLAPRDEEPVPAFAAAFEAGADQGRSDRPGLQVIIDGRGWLLVRDPATDEEADQETNAGVHHGLARMDPEHQCRCCRSALRRCSSR